MSPTAPADEQQSTAALPILVYCGGTTWDGPRGTDRQLSEQLTRYARVLFVDPPASLHTGVGRRSLPGMLAGTPEVLGERLSRLTPVAPPWKTRTGMWRLTEWLVRVSMRRATRRMGGDVRAVVVATLDDLFGVCGEEHRVLFGTDDLVAGAELIGLPARRLVGRERRLLAGADVTAAVSPTLVDKWRHLGAHPHLFPNGCDATGLADVDAAPLPDDVQLAAPIAGVIGYLSERIDFDLLDAVAATGVSLLLIGPRAPGIAARMDTLLTRANVQWVGAKPYESLVRYLRVIDVGLVPYANTPFNRASFPLKMLEYVAAGRGVVTTDLPAARWLDTDLVEVASTPRTFAESVVRALACPRTPEVAAARHELAEHNSWERRAERFAQLVGLAPNGAEPAVVGGRGDVG